MKKLKITLLLTILTVALLTGYAHADNNLTEETVAAKIEELDNASSLISSPKNITFITTNDNVIISGFAKDKDTITMTTYTKSGTTYKFLDQRTLVIGPLGTFTTELSLKYLGATPKSVIISEETYVHLKLVRGTQVIEDVRLIKHTSDDKIQQSLSSLRTGSLLSN